MITEEEYENAQSIVNRYKNEQERKPGNCFEFNINDAILVRLNDRGYKHWLDSYGSLSKAVTFEDFKKRADQDGYVEFQAWDFINIFGKVTGMGHPIYYDTNLRFLKKQMKEIEKKR